MLLNVVKHYSKHSAPRHESSRRTCKTTGVNAAGSAVPTDDNGRRVPETEGHLRPPEHSEARDNEKKKDATRNRFGVSTLGSFNTEHYETC